jgi:Tol biopolymer transport system component
LFLTSNRLKSVSLQGGKEKGYSCAPGPSTCWPAAFIVSAKREYAAVMIFSDDTPSFTLSIELLKLRSGRDPVVVGNPWPSGDESDSALAFSPDSRQLVFSSCQPIPPYGCGGGGLFAASIPGGTPVPLAQSGIPGAALVPGDVQHLQWSPDGRWVAFDEGQNLEVAPTTGASTPRVLATCVAPFDAMSGFSWSPTSQSLAVVCSSSYDGSRQLITVRPDGTHLTNLLADRGLTIPYDAGDFWPEWSPDGSRLLFVASYGTGYPSRVWTIRPDGYDLTRHS